MTRELFDKKLREMQDDVLIMGSMVEKAVQRSMEAPVPERVYGDEQGRRADPAADGGGVRFSEWERVFGL